MSEVTYEATGDPVGFSWSPCDRCGSPLGGERHEWFYVEENGSKGNGEICIDCLYHVNGLEMGD